ncbi:MAG TPA: substrate-binding domain-containing protein [Desulfotignum sp.]|jgi:phosphate transport system substrate-binding protein|nr:substrate-binding domain-containing protein [Desulfotignum sp.]
MKKSVIKWCVMGFLMVSGLFLGTAAAADQTLSYSSSAQVFEAFENSRLNTFTQETGIAIDLFVASSQSCVYRLLQGMTDVASSVRPLSQREKDFGLVAFPFAKDPLAVITHKSTPVDALTSEQLQMIFSGGAANWKEVGGPDLAITLVVPGEETGAHKNFRRQVMRHMDVQYHYMTYTSTRVLEAIESLPPGAVSFISRGAQITHPQVKVVQIDGKMPGDADYPYYQIFNLVTKGEPAGTVKTFVEFITSDKGAALIRERGMLPVE